MRHWLVIDLEATTEEGGWPLEDMEIIEIGACLVSPAGQEIGHLQRFVRPLRRPLLTRFEQAEVDAAPPFAQVWPEVEHWLLSQAGELLGWASWGDYDRRQLDLEWQRNGLSSRLQQLEHLNLKQGFAQARQLRRPVGLKSALQLAGLQFAGAQHRALDDARNTARLLPLSLPV